MLCFARLNSVIRPVSVDAAAKASHRSLRGHAGLSAIERRSLERMAHGF
jgi:hypothetical protein